MYIYSALALGWQYRFTKRGGLDL